MSLDPDSDTHCLEGFIICLDKNGKPSCSNCKPKYFRKCFCETHGDCGDCASCVDSVCEDGCSEEELAQGKQCYEDGCKCPPNKPHEHPITKECQECIEGEVNPLNPCVVCKDGNWATKPCPGGKCDPSTGDCIKDCSLNTDGRTRWNPETQSCDCERGFEYNHELLRCVVKKGDCGRGYRRNPETEECEPIQCVEGTMYSYELDDCIVMECDSVVCETGEDCGENCGCLDNKCVKCSSLTCSDDCKNTLGCTCSDDGLRCEKDSDPCAQFPCGEDCANRPDCKCNETTNTCESDDGPCEDLTARKLTDSEGNCRLEVSLGSNECCACPEILLDYKLISVNASTDPNKQLILGEFEVRKVIGGHNYPSAIVENEVPLINNTDVRDVLQDDDMTSGFYNVFVQYFTTSVDSEGSPIGVPKLDAQKTLLETRSFASKDQIRASFETRKLGVISNGVLYSKMKITIEVSDFQNTQSGCEYKGAEIGSYIITPTNIGTLPALNSNNTYDYLIYKEFASKSCKNPAIFWYKAEYDEVAGELMPFDTNAFRKLYLSKENGSYTDYIDKPNYNPKFHSDAPGVADNHGELWSGYGYMWKTDCGCKGKSKELIWGTCDTPSRLVFCDPKESDFENSIELIECNKKLRFTRDLTTNCVVNYNLQSVIQEASSVATGDFLSRLQKAQLKFTLLINGVEVFSEREPYAEGKGNIIEKQNKMYESPDGKSITEVALRFSHDMCPDCEIVIYKEPNDIPEVSSVVTCEKENGLATGKKSITFTLPAGVDEIYNTTLYDGGNLHFDLGKVRQGNSITFSNIPNNVTEMSFTFSHMSCEESKIVNLDTNIPCCADVIEHTPAPMIGQNKATFDFTASIPLGFVNYQILDGVSKTVIKTDNDTILTYPFKFELDKDTATYPDTGYPQVVDIVVNRDNNPNCPLKLTYNLQVQEQPYAAIAAIEPDCDSVNVKFAITNNVGPNKITSIDFQLNGVDYTVENITGSFAERDIIYDDIIGSSLNVVIVGVNSLAEFNSQMMTGQKLVAADFIITNVNYGGTPNNNMCVFSSVVNNDLGTYSGDITISGTGTPGLSVSFKDFVITGGTSKVAGVDQGVVENDGTFNLKIAAKKSSDQILGVNSSMVYNLIAAKLNLDNADCLTVSGQINVKKCNTLSLSILSEICEDTTGTVSMSVNSQVDKNLTTATYLGGGSIPLSYSQNDTVITLNNVTIGQPYQLIAYSTDGRMGSKTDTLSCGCSLATPQIPDSFTQCLGETVSSSVLNLSDYQNKPVSYQWYKAYTLNNNILVLPITGETNSTISGVTVPTGATNFRLYVEVQSNTNSNCKETSNSMFVTDITPDYTVTPVNETCGQGNGSISLTDIKGNITQIEWYKGNMMIGQGTVVNNLSAGSYKVRVYTDPLCFTEIPVISVGNSTDNCGPNCQAYEFTNMVLNQTGGLNLNAVGLTYNGAPLSSFRIEWRNSSNQIVFYSGIGPDLSSTDYNHSSAPSLIPLASGTYTPTLISAEGEIVNCPLSTVTVAKWTCANPPSYNYYGPGGAQATIEFEMEVPPGTTKLQEVDFEEYVIEDILELFWNNSPTPFAGSEIADTVIVGNNPQFLHTVLPDSNGGVIKFKVTNNTPNEDTQWNLNVAADGCCTQAPVCPPSDILDNVIISGIGRIATSSGYQYRAINVIDNGDTIAANLWSEPGSTCESYYKRSSNAYSYFAPSCVVAQQGIKGCEDVGISFIKSGNQLTFTLNDNAYYTDLKTEITNLSQNQFLNLSVSGDPCESGPAIEETFTFTKDGYGASYVFNDVDMEITVSINSSYDFEADVNYTGDCADKMQTDFGYFVLNKMANYSTTLVQFQSAVSLRRRNIQVSGGDPNHNGTITLRVNTLIGGCNDVIKIFYVVVDDNSGTYIIHEDNMLGPVVDSGNITTL